jgi:uncharacterized repeat protein (TIGR01451 family)
MTRSRNIFLKGIFFAVLAGILCNPSFSYASGTLSAQTLSASNISQNSATLNGIAEEHSLSSITVWFEYGTTQNLGASTGHQNIGQPQAANASFSSSIGTLNPHTTYFYRAVAKNNIEIVYGTIVSFTTSGTPSGNAPAVITETAASISQTSATLNSSINPNQSSTDAWFEWGVTSSLGNTTARKNIGGGASSVSFSEFVSGLNSNTTYYYRVAAENIYGVSRGSIMSFTTSYGGSQGSAPSAVTYSASSIGQNSGTLNGTVNPNGLSTTAWFEWGSNSSLGSVTGSQSVGNGTSHSNISTFLGSLSTNTTYYYRVVAQNSAGTSYGSIVSFTTSYGGSQGGAPSVSTQSAYSINQNSATLQGNANPNGNYTSAWFEYGTSYSLGYISSSQSIGSGSSSSGFSVSVYNLNPYTTYYYRAVAQNSYGTTYGTILSFTTSNYGGGGQQYSLPSVSTNSATNLSQSSATLNGLVNPNGNYANAWFEYGTNYALGTTVGYQTVGTYYGSSQIQYNLTGLQQNTTYYYRAIASNSSGTTYGNIMSFTTSQYFQYGQAPIISTIPAMSVLSNSAILRGLVNPNGLFTRHWFEWGGTQSLGQTTASQSLGSGSNQFEFTSILTGLSSGNSYYYRAVAENSYGRVYGNIISFTTTGGFIAPPPAPTPAPSQPVTTPAPQPIRTTQPLLLLSSTDSANPAPGDEIVYTIIYRNTDLEHSLTDLSLAVILPKNTSFVRATTAPRSAAAGVVHFSLSDIAPGNEESIAVSVKISDEADRGDVILLSGKMDYRDSANRARTTNTFLGITIGAKEIPGLAELFENLRIPIEGIFIVILIAIVGWAAYRTFSVSKAPAGPQSVDELKIGDH